MFTPGESKTNKQLKDENYHINSNLSPPINSFSHDNPSSFKKEKSQ